MKGTVTLVQASDADEFADQYELHCSQQSPVKDRVTFPAADGVVVTKALDVVAFSMEAPLSVVLMGTVDRDSSTVSVEWVIPSPAAMKSPTFLDVVSTLDEVDFVAEASDEDGEVAADCERERAVELAQRLPVPCAELVRNSDENA